MDINAVSAGTSGSRLSGTSSPSASKKASDSMGLNKALNQGAIVTGLLPALSSGTGSSGSSGISDLSDIYTAVGMQTQGMMSRGLMGIQIANISLGIDMSQAAKDAQVKDGQVKEAVAAKDGDATKDADKGSEPTAVPAPDATRYYTSPGLSNPALGGLLNSLG